MRSGCILVFFSFLCFFAYLTKGVLFLSLVGGELVLGGAFCLCGTPVASRPGGATTLLRIHLDSRSGHFFFPFLVFACYS